MFFVLVTHINDTGYEITEYQSFCTRVHFHFRFVSAIATDGVHILIPGMGYYCYEQGNYKPYCNVEEKKKFDQ